jgi:alkyl hydroperoxide reductase subunit AhpC
MAIARAYPKLHPDACNSTTIRAGFMIDPRCVILLYSVKPTKGKDWYHRSETSRGT